MPIRKKDESLVIPELTVARFKVRIVGVTPLIMHRFSEAAQEKIEKKQQGVAKVKDPPRDPEAEFQAAIYRTPDGSYGFPAIGVKKAMVTAGMRFAGEKATHLYGAFSIPQELLEVEAGEPRMRTDRVSLSGIGRIQSVAYRPEFFPWAMEIPLLVNSNFVQPDQLINLLRIAGFGVGIGDWRVEMKGSFGQFSVEEAAATAAS